MAENQLVFRLKELGRSVCERKGVRLYDVEFVSGSRGRGRVVRFYIDREPGGVTISDCSEVSHALSLELDVENVIPGGDYSLEVSSPGLDRTMREPWHFQTAVGAQIELKLKEPLVSESDTSQQGNRLRYTGTLVEAVEEEIVLEMDKNRIQIPFHKVEKAKKIFMPTKQEPLNRKR